MKEKKKLNTGAMLNPKCQECSKRDKCNNKTLCAYLIPDSCNLEFAIENSKKSAKEIADAITKAINSIPEVVENSIKIEIKGIGRKHIWR